MQQDVQELTQMRGAPVVSNDGEQIGEVEEIFLDNETGKPEWVSLSTGMLGTKHALVPLEGAEVQKNAISVPYAAGQVKDSPKVDAAEISQEQEQEIYAHYGLAYGESRSDSGLPEGGAPTSSTTDEAEFVRSEEELSVGKQQVHAGTARLRKWVETEPVSADVELQREAARVTREPINEPVSGAEIGDQEVEVPLSAEQATVQKQTVAKERIGVEKDVETETQTISDDVRRERVEIDGDNIEGR
jgi:uncharacterized protein (TIGR02271 family)